MKSAILLLLTLFFSISVLAKDVPAAGGGGPEPREPEAREPLRDSSTPEVKDTREPKGRVFDFIDRVFTPKGLRDAAKERQRQWDEFDRATKKKGY
tara:strand:+ start:633 stop:920 length:288 start_codon:yes stop_codon:yes gene_type:complete